MKKFLNLALILFVASISFVSCSDDESYDIPELKKNAEMVLQNGETKTITTSELSFSDTDSEDSEILFTVVTAPENGKLVNKNNSATPITSFTQQDIVDEKIQYIHDGSQTLSDSFTFNVTDGNNVLTDFTFSITIGVKTISYFYVLNEGSTNGSITLINKKGEVTNNYYESVNELPLGKFPQSMAMNDDYAFIVVTTTTGAGYVEVVEKATFKHVKTITGLSYPREITLVDNKAYVSNGTGADANYAKENNEIHVIDLDALAITKEIAVGAGPEKMVVSNGKLYVANSGGWSNDDNTVTVVDIATDEVINTIEVKNCPKDMVADASGDIWVYCGGKPDYSNWPNVTYANAGISKIAVSSDEVTSFDLTNIATSGIKNITISKEKDVVYFMSDAVYAMSISADALPTTKLIDKTFYGMDVNPQNGDLWLCEAFDATTPGVVHVYSTEGKELKNFTVGSMPNSTSFSY